MPHSLRDMPRYPIAAASAVAGIDAGTLKNWIARGLVPLAEGERSSAAGSPRLLSFRRVLQVAVTAELVRLGVPIGRAFVAACKFTDTGNSRRGNGELFAEGSTVLILGASDPEVRQVKDALRLTDLFTTQSRGAAVLLLDDIVAGVRSQLRVPAEVVA